ncbi:hypothetical protein BWQ96_03761 [Gracilariopsis chorda]|uniref:Uncharacterized protein n=1 Tax=Gracilariopsis chorda TaxID=448386 RepID=A0A2V3IWK9_9FLOR|nr:hypothetical protein BWQ96_03761 [Gracilariopsis chorda]|eukprot:PXF46526.1 hypothetical protein BWQ96_03761 [Gracilariopsis chorda]
MSSRILWDMNRLPMRSTEQLSVAQEKSKNLKGREMEEYCKGIGLLSPLVGDLIPRSSILFRFSSFPIDLMHLLFENIAPHMVSIWCGDVKGCEDPEDMGSVKANAEVGNRLLSAGKGFSSKIWRPRRIDERKKWKTTEWKSFVQEVSLLVLVGIIPKKAMDGWKTFVHLCELLCRWSVTRSDMDHIYRLSRKFFQHFNDTYYQNDYGKVNVCWYLYHLLLHVSDSIQDCSPLSLVSQWAVENYVGAHNHNCNGTNLFAESVEKGKRFYDSSILYAMRTEVHMPLL